MRLTPKQAVLKVWPTAHAHLWACGTVSVYRPLAGGNLNLGSGKGYVNAWKAAWQQVKSDLRRARDER